MVVVGVVLSGTMVYYPYLQMSSSYSYVLWPSSLLRVAATGHYKRLFFKVVCCLYVLSLIGRAVSGVTVAYIGLCLFCLYKVENSQTSNIGQPIFSGRRDDRNSLQDNN